MSKQISKDDGKQLEAFTRRWLEELRKASEREKGFRKTGYGLVQLYEAGKQEDSPYNILFANTDTLSPALYNNPPRPVVQRRFKDADPLGRLACQAGERILTYLLDGGSPTGGLDTALQEAVLQALVPGRGVTRFYYDIAEQEAANEEAADAAEGTSGSDDDSDAEPPGRELPPPRGTEMICIEDVPWDRFRHGYAKKWAQVPWIAYDWLMTKEELEKNFGPIAIRVELTNLSDKGADDDSPGGKEKTGQRGAVVTEIWDKASRKVFFITEGYPEAPLKLIDDPLQLQGFFNCPEPLQFMQKISGLTPTALYQQYEAQAKELNDITRRITKLVRALRIRGGYDASISGIENILEAEDNQLVPVDNLASISQNGGTLEKALFLVPIERLVTVLQQLYAQRAQVKQVIFEITGIADIMRGSTAASETLGAQELKNQWGTLRLKRMQKRVARYSRDCLRLMLEIAVTTLDEQTIAGMTGMQLLSSEQKQQAQLLLDQFQQVGQQPTPEIVQAASSPGWPEVIALLRNDLSRNFRIDIETNSTVDVEATEDKNAVGETLNAMSQFLSGVSPLVQSGSMPFEVARDMLLSVVRRFRFGTEIEDSLAKMQPPQPQPDPKADAAKEQNNFDMQLKQLDMQAKQMELQQKERLMQMQMEQAQLEHNLKMAQLQMQLQAAQAAHVMKMQATQHQAKKPGITGQ